ncbi:MAG: 16S rRNA (cytosine(1402)-N(4))-methyltransferase RsmH [Candidatus Paceibacterota bacterium]
MSHISVLNEEVVTALNLKSDSTVVDCTLGSGGHAQVILSKLGRKGTYIGIDVDRTAIELQQDLKTNTAAVHLVCSNFVDITTVLTELEIKCTDAILADLGWRTEQFIGGGKGFSFSENEPLLMTYGDPATYTFTAHDIVNTWDEESIADVIYGYGEERFSRRIAKAIVSAREDAVITTSKQLALIVAAAIPARFQNRRIHPATKTFQALRITVNNELETLKKFLTEAFEALCPNGRLAIITFHSLEDRIVKNYFRDQARDQAGLLITKKPITATDAELAQNPRARSAKLRILEKK